MVLGKDSVFRGSSRRKVEHMEELTMTETTVDYSKNAENTFRVFVNNNLRTPSRQVAVAMEIRDSKKAGIVEAELVFISGESIVIDWNNTVEREKHLHMINGYTLIYDRREKKQFDTWKKKQA